MNNESAEFYSKALAVASNAVMEFMKVNKPQLTTDTAMIAVDAVNKGIASRPSSQEIRQNPSGTYDFSQVDEVDWLAVILSTAAFGYTIYQITKVVRTKK